MIFESKEVIEIEKGLDNIESVVNNHFEQMKKLSNSLSDQEREFLEKSLNELAHIYDATDDIRVHKSDINNDRYTDNLTNLYNRAALEEYAKKLKNETYLIFMDLNNFKKANDTMGHEVGDGALKELGDLLLGEEMEHIRKHVGNMIASKTKANDLMVRYGGDEFIVIPEKISDKDTAIKISYRLMDAINHNFDRFNDKYNTKIGVSVGIAKWNPKEDNFKIVKDFADKAMYASKSKKNEENQPIAVYDGKFEYAIIDNGNIKYNLIPKNELRD